MATQEIGIREITEDQLSLIKKTIAKDATPDELKLFFYDCHRRGVHPLDKLIHFTKRQGKYTPITSIDFMRIRAADSGEYAGSDDPLFEELPAPAKNPSKATVVVYRMVQGQRCPFSATARWAEYAPANIADNSAFMWRKMPFTMLGKCAEALALRKAFPGQLQGLYAKEEMDQADSTPRMEPQQAKAYVQEQLAKLPPKKEEFPVITNYEEPASDYEESPDGSEARFSLVSVESKTGRNGDYRKVNWNGGAASCFDAELFDTLDKLKAGDVIYVGLKKKGNYANIVSISQSQRSDADDTLFAEAGDAVS